MDFEMTNWKWLLAGGVAAVLLVFLIATGATQGELIILFAVPVLAFVMIFVASILVEFIVERVRAAMADR